MAKKKSGALYDECHGIDLIRFFFGEVLATSAFVEILQNLKYRAMIQLF